MKNKTKSKPESLHSQLIENYAKGGKLTKLQGRLNFLTGY